MKRLIIDRLEEGAAVCEAEDLSYISVPVCDLPDGAREGDALIETENGYELDAEYTRRRREIILDKQKSIFKKSEK